MGNVIILSELDEKLLEVGYNAMSLIDKNRLIGQIGSSKGVSYTTLTDTDVLNYHKDIKKYVLSDTCEDEIIKGFTSSNGHTYRTDRDDQTRMLGQHAMIDIASLTEVEWKTEDVGYITHTVADWRNQVFIEGFIHIKDTLFRLRSLRDKIDLATTHEDLVGISWDMTL